MAWDLPTEEMRSWSMPAWRWILEGRPASGTLQSASPRFPMPPGSPIDVSSPLPASSVFFVTVPAGWSGALRAGALRQLFLCLEGEIEVVADDGETRCFPPGSALIMDAGSGREHPCQVAGAIDARVAVVQLSN